MVWYGMAWWWRGVALYGVARRRDVPLTRPPFVHSRRASNKSGLRDSLAVIKSPS